MTWFKLIFLAQCLATSQMVAAQSLVTKTDCLSAVTWGEAVGCPMITSWVITKADLQGSIGRSTARFVQDPRFPSPSVCHDDFTNTGYDRGHIVPSEDRQSSPLLNKMTFRLSNVCPQLPKLNRGQWKQTEMVCRQLVGRYDSVRVSVHAIFTPHWVQRLANGRIRVPDHFRKVAAVAATDSVIYIWDMCNHE